MTVLHAYTLIVAIIQCLQNVPYSLLSLQNIMSMCEGPTSKQTPEPKNSTAPGPRPPILKFLDPPLVCSMFNRKWELAFPKNLYHQRSVIRMSVRLVVFGLIKTLKVNMDHLFNVISKLFNMGLFKGLILKLRSQSYS